MGGSIGELVMRIFSHQFLPHLPLRPQQGSVVIRLLLSLYPNQYSLLLQDLQVSQAESTCLKFSQYFVPNQLPKKCYVVGLWYQYILCHCSCVPQNLLKLVYGLRMQAGHNRDAHILVTTSGALSLDNRVP